MSARFRLACLSSIGLLSLLSGGCIVIGGSGWGWFGSPAVWTEQTTETFTVDRAGIRTLDVTTHNGAITFEGRGNDVPEIVVTATKKAGGATIADAEAALAAIDVYAKPSGGDTYRVGWKWKGVRHAFWRGQVSFEIQGPGDLVFDGRTHNGSIEIEGAGNDVHTVTHNGSVDVEAQGGELYAETHNGSITAIYTGDDVTLLTHNGRVVADLNKCGPISGSITTNNGRVEVLVGENTSTELKCRTHNGSIKCNVPVDNCEITKHRLTGTIGSGDGDLEVTTHNGSVHIRKTTG